MVETSDAHDKTQAVFALLSEHAGVALEDSPELRQQTLAELGFSSVTFMVIIVELEEVLDRPFDDANMFAGVRTLGDLLETIGLG